MPIDPNIALQVKPVQLANPLEQYGQMMQIQQAQNQNRLADLMYGEKQREVNDSNTLNQLYKSAVGADGQIDRNKLYSGLAQGGLGSKLPAIQKGFADQDKSLLEAQKAKIETGLKQFEMVGQLMSGVNDQATYDAARQQAASILGPEAASKIPPVYDPAEIERNKLKAMTVKDQMEQQLKTLKFKLDNANEAFSLGADGKPVANEQYQQYQFKKAKAGKTDVNLSVNTEKGFLGEVAKGVGNSVENSMNQAKAAVGTLSNISQIRSALDSGKIITGPGADTKITLKQLGLTLGLGGKDDAETLANTRALMQAMAGQELSAAEAMRGQGAITENERTLIKRAASGDISMTAPEINALTQAIEKTARFKIRSHAENVKRLGSNPNAAPVVDFMRVDEPPAYSSPKGGNAGFKYLGKEQ